MYHLSWVIPFIVSYNKAMKILAGATVTLGFICGRIHSRAHPPVVGRSQFLTSGLTEVSSSLAVCQSEWVKVTQSCPTLCDPTDYTVHGILQARILEWVAFPFSRVSSQPRDQTHISHIAGRFFTCWATRVGQKSQSIPCYLSLFIM